MSAKHWFGDLKPKRSHFKRCGNQGDGVGKYVASIDPINNVRKLKRV